MYEIKSSEHFNGYTCLQTTRLIPVSALQEPASCRDRTLRSPRLRMTMKMKMIMITNDDADDKAT